jgi:hypothetical protein
MDFKSVKPNRRKLGAGEIRRTKRTHERISEQAIFL